MAEKHKRVENAISKKDFNEFYILFNDTTRKTINILNKMERRLSWLEKEFLKNFSEKITKMEGTK